MLNVSFDESTVSRRKVYERYMRFKDGREDVEDDEHLERPNTSIPDRYVEKVEFHDIFSIVFACDFFLFLKIKITLTGRCISIIDEIEKASLKELNAISKNEFRNCFMEYKNAGVSVRCTLRGFL